MSAVAVQRLEYAVLAASGYIADEGGKEDEEDDYEPPEHSMMAGSEADRADNLDEYREEDLVHLLHERNYTYSDIYGLLRPEIEQLVDGIERAEKRREREESGSVGTSSSGGQGNRRSPHGDSLF